MKFFPIQGGANIPWEFAEKHRKQMEKNHGQTLERLAERHGLSVWEMWCAMRGLDPCRYKYDKNAADAYESALQQAAYAVPEMKARIEQLEAQVKTAEEKLNTPVSADFFEGLKAEIDHQRARWSEADENKTDSDWFWLLGYLAGKALGQPEKRLHHTITAAAALYHWHTKTAKESGV